MGDLKCQVRCQLIPPPHTHSVSAGKQKCVLFPLQVSLPAVHRLGLKGSNGRVKASPGKEKWERACLHPCPLCPSRGSSSRCHCGPKSRQGDSLPSSCHPPSAHLLPRPLSGYHLHMWEPCNLDQASLSFCFLICKIGMKKRNGPHRGDKKSLSLPKHVLTACLTHS